MTLKNKILSAFSAIALIAGGTVAFTTLSSTPAIAQSQNAKSVVDSAKTKGVIGETIAGYLAETGSGSISPSERAAMNEINIGRKSIYTRKARHIITKAADSPQWLFL